MAAYAGYSPRITELLAQQGRDAADLRRQTGQTTLNVLTNIGNIAANVPGQIVEAQKADRAKQQLDLAHKLAVQFRRPDGTTDFEQVLTGLRQAGAHEAADEVEKQLVTQRAQDAARKKDELAAQNTQSEIKAREITTNLAQNADTRAASAANATAAEKAAAAQRVETVKGILTKHADPATGKITDWPTAIDEVRAIDPEAADHLAASWKSQQSAQLDATTAQRTTADAERRSAAQLLSRYVSAADYAAKRAKLSPEVAAYFPEQPPKNRRDLLTIGLTPKEEIDVQIDQQRANQSARSSAEPLEAVIGPNGQPVLVPRSQAIGKMPATSREKPTEDERKSAGFYAQMRDAMSTIDELENQITDKELYQIQSLPQETLVGMLNRNELSEAAKRYLRAFEQFTESRLRPVSGAAINDAEYARDRRTYAKQFGETTKLGEDRKRARNLALESLGKRAGVLTPGPAGGSAPAPPPGWVIK